MDKETEDRIFAVANALYEESDRVSIPTVHLVRKTARASMNDVGDAMKKWRDLQRVKPTVPVLVHVPQPIEEASRALLGSLWQSAQELSNNALRSAQAGWDAERLEATAMRKEVADGYELKVLEVEAAQAEITRLQASAVTSANDVAQLQRELEAMRGELSVATADLADALAVIAHLKNKMAQADTDADALKNQLADAQALAQKHVFELAQLRERLDAQEKQGKQAGMEHTAELDRLDALLKDERKSHAAAIAQQRNELQEQARNAAAARDALNREIVVAKAETAAAKQAQSQHETSTQQRVIEADTKLREAAQTTSQARENAAQLRGQVDAMEKQMADMLGIIARWKASPDEKKALEGQVQAAAAGDFVLTSTVPEVSVVSKLS